MRLLSGKWPWEDEEAEGLWEKIKNYFFPKTGRTNPNGSAERLSLPHYSKDWVAWGTGIRDVLTDADPSSLAKTAKHKAHPMWGTIADIVENEDYYGTEIRDPDDPFLSQVLDAAKHVGASFLPFSVRNFSRMRDAGESRSMAVLMAGSGISSAPGYLSKTRAHQAVDDILRERMPSGSRSQEDAEKSERRRETIRELRKGSKVDLSSWTTREQSSIKREAAMTPLQARFGRLTADEAVRVFNLCNTKEREQLWPVLLKKASRRDVPQYVREAFYELKLNQAQIDERIKADMQTCRNLAYTISNPTTSPERRKELLAQLQGVKEYEDDWKFVFAVFRHRWLFSPDGRRTGRAIGDAFWKRVSILRAAWMKGQEE
jgi:hypothetical protein